MNKIVILCLAVFCISCVSPHELLHKEHFNKNQEDINKIRVIGNTPEIFDYDFYYKRLNERKSKDTKKYDVAKIKRKLDEYEIESICDNEQINEELNKSIKAFFNSLYVAEDISTILVNDSIEEYFNKYQDRYFLLYTHTGYILSPDYVFVHDLPYAILRIVTLGIFNIYISNGVSYAQVALVDKEQKKAIYYGSVNRAGLPTEEYIVNKLFEVTIEGLMNKVKEER